MEYRGKNKLYYFEIDEINEESLGMKITKINDILWRENGILQGILNKETKPIGHKARK
jgi:hypothetical protein